MDAYIQNRHCTTVGLHKNCPRARYVGGTSGHVCECRSEKVLEVLRNGPTGFKAPNPLPVVDGE